MGISWLRSTRIGNEETRTATRRFISFFFEGGVLFREGCEFLHLKAKWPICA